MLGQGLAVQVTTYEYLDYPAGEYVWVQGYPTQVKSQERAGFQIGF